MFFKKKPELKEEDRQKLEKEKVKKYIKSLTSTKEVKLLQRGNNAVFIALQIAKRLGKTDVLIQDQGGWLTYKQYASKLEMKVIELKTDYGLIDVKKLADKLNENSVLIVNSLTGYFAEQSMRKIANIAKDKKILLINDVSGSIGTRNARYGDIIFGSFGNWKPINLGEGAFIAVKDDKNFKFFDIEEFVLNYSELLKKIDMLGKRIKFLYNTCRKIKKELKKEKIIYPDSYCLNVVIMFDNDIEKEKIINYCNTNNLPYTICPREIRVNANAISIEVKRLEEGKKEEITDKKIDIAEEE